MNYHLSTNVILNTVHAMAALQAMACGPEQRTLLAPILCRERTVLLAGMIKNAFVEVVLKLGPLVADMDMGGEADDVADCSLTVELITPAGLSTSRHTLVRRALEQTVAHTVLYMWCRASLSAGASGGVAASLADSFASIASGWHDTLVSYISPATYPTIRC